MIVAYHLTPAHNLATIERRGLVPTVGVRSALAAEPTKAIYCFRDLDTLDAGLLNWLDDQFDTDEPLALLRLELPDSYAVHTDEVAFELRVMVNVPARCIAVLSTDYGVDSRADASAHRRAAEMDAALLD